MTADWRCGLRDRRRLAAVERSGLIGGGPEDALDRLIELASELTGVARGCITLVDASTTTAMSSIGFPHGLTLSAPVELSFCRLVVASGRPFMVDDARVDPRTIGDPAIEAFSATAWIGYAIHDPAGHVLGTFCLMDSEPHAWTAQDVHVVATLARAASTEIALRSARTELGAARREIASLRLAVSAAGRGDRSVVGRW
jgi:GAF domain-containing protein